jgi:hypothetical protein
MRMGMKDMTYSRNYRANERKFQHGPILRGKCLVFVDKRLSKVSGQILILKSCESEHNSTTHPSLVVDLYT